MKRIKWLGSILVLVATAVQACPVVTHGYGYGYAGYPTYSYPQTYYPPAYTPYYPTYTPVYAAVFTPLLTVSVPAATVGYSPPTVTPATVASAVPTTPAGASAASGAGVQGTTPAPSPCEQRVAKLEGELAEIRAYLAGKASAQQPPAATEQHPLTGSQPPAPPDAAFLTVAANKCAACHGGAAKDADLAAGFRLTTADGKENPGLTARDWEKVAGKVGANRMPPKEAWQGHKTAPLTEQEWGIVMGRVNEAMQSTK